VGTDVLLVEIGGWLPLGLPEGRWLVGFDKKSRIPDGTRLRKKGAAAPRGEACNSLWLQFSRYRRYFARRAVPPALSLIAPSGVAVLSEKDFHFVFRNLECF
jgi:hypothetical protein